EVTGDDYGTVEPEGTGDENGTVEPEVAGDENDVEEPETAGDEATDEEPESEYANLAIAQVNNYVNVRQEPTTDSAVLGKIYNGAVAQILDVAGEEQDWFHVVSGSVDGYVKAEFFLYGDAAVEAVDNYLTRYATVIANRLNVRQEPGTDSKRIGFITHGEKVKILEILEDWMLVQYTGDRTGYVASEYVTVSEEFIYAKSIEEERAEQEALREMARRMAQQEQATPENTAVTLLTPPATVYTSNEELRSSIVAYAMQYLGYPYVHGGKSLATGTDCSGFTCYIYADFGYSISRTPSGQYSSDGKSIDYSEIQPGDIICYGKSKCTHVGMYIGDGKIIHAANSRKGVVIYDATYDNILGVKSIID
ncbi:MAG: C40 family peptidase, partial [Acetatifactor sp.]|nr:C40 family peptidase [Acetatifactor sp.]